MEIEQLRIDKIYENRLDMKSFARMLESPTQCYKFYWLEAILTLLPNHDEISFEEIIHEMFWEAWYTVTQYHLHLGPTIQGKSENYIEHAVHIIEQDTEAKLPMSNEQFNYLLEKNRTKIKPDVDGLIKNVPYRLLSSFASEISGDDRIWDQKKRLIAYIELLNETQYLPYIIIDGRGASRKIRMNEAWKQVLLDNYSVIHSWIQMKKIRFLQDRNPGVPGIVYKLEDGEDRQRRLAAVRELWTTYEIVKQKPLTDFYSGEKIEKNKLSIDHFIPWSYVVNDELWNLIPMDKSLNSRKGNKLPKWDKFFPKFANVQYELCTSIFESTKIQKKFETCKNFNLYSTWAQEELYRRENDQTKFFEILDHNMKPIYESAYLQGYEIWGDL